MVCPVLLQAKERQDFEEVKPLLELVVMGGNRQSPLGPDPVCFL